jgi:Ran GTPase-activating protein (RanGAP) involved in mRNA processing and transport
VQHFRCTLGRAEAAPIITGLGKLPDLHTLDLPGFAAGGVSALAAGKFPALARLGLSLSDAGAKTLAKGKFPALTVFEAGGIEKDGFLALLKSKWFGQLRVLGLSDNLIGDKGVAALAAHPVAKTLRVLKFGDNPFGPGGLKAIGKPGAFPALTTLNLHSYHKRKGKPADLAAFLSQLQMPNLRHLDLMGWPLGNEGAQALAANPSLGNLTRLNLESCEIGDPGAKALFASPHLQKLVELHLGYNAIKTGADALADPAVLPRLGECWISGNKIPKKAADKFHREGLYLIT